MAPKTVERELNEEINLLPSPARIPIKPSYNFSPEGKMDKMTHKMLDIKLEKEKRRIARLDMNEDLHQQSKEWIVRE